MTNIYKYRGKLPGGHLTNSGESWVTGDLVHIKGEPHIYSNDEGFCLKVIPESVGLCLICEETGAVTRLAPVVRCEKCLYRSQYADENGLYKCGAFETKDGLVFKFEPDFFCAYGERRCNDD